MATKIVEHCQIAPSSGAPTEQLLKLLRMDMLFFKYPCYVNTLFFYKLHCSESHFMDTIVPNLKNSLSLTLKHFPPFAGKLLIDNNSGLPVSHYVSGQDSLSLTIAVSYADFLNLTGYHPRDIAQLHGFTPDLSRSSALAIQLTLFPNQGVCLGITGDHAIGDGATLLLFLKTWASINRSNGDDSQSGNEYLPFYDRDVVTDGYRRAMEFWRDIETLPSPFASTVPLIEQMLEATFVLSEAEIRKLKNLAIAANSKKGGTMTVRVSSFVVACAHLWTCLAKSEGEEMDNDEPGYLSFPVDCRGRFNPPLPDNYFGNCTAFVLTESTYGKLRGKEGFLAAAEAITGTIEKAVGNGRGAIEGSQKLYLDILMLQPDRVLKRLLTVGGSSGFDFYGTEFGWGKPIKFEALHGINNSQVAFFSNSREYRGIEICVSLPKVKMAGFATSFNQALAQATEKLQCKM